MAYEPSIPAPQQRTPADGMVIGNTVILNSTGNKSPVAVMKEVKGGLHFVEYLEYLSENSYRGVTIGRRVEGMLAYVQKHWNNGADTFIGKYYKLKTLSANGDATWEELNFGGNTVTPNNTYPVGTVPQRDALPNLVTGDIVIVADASGDTTEVPALVGGATYIKTDDGWLRFLYPEDPNLAKLHDQNTDQQLIVVKGGNTYVLTSVSIYDHINDETIHFKINDANVAGAKNEVYSSKHLNDNFIKKNPAGAVNKFFNERGEAIEVDVDFNLTRINGGNASTIFPA